MKSGSFQVFARIFEYIIKYFKWVVVFAAVLIVLSGIYRVQSNEVAIVLRLGSLAGRTQIKNPGLHFALPFFIDEVIKIPVQLMHERDITTHYIVWRGRLLPDVENNGYLLTGDNNIVLLRASVLYQIENPVLYAIRSSDTGQIIDGVVSGELTRIVTQMDIDSVLTTGRAQLSSAVLNNSQRALDELETGVVITAVELIGVVPPMETAQFFDDVRSAAVEKETLIQRAQEFASSYIINAQAQAGSYTQSAISDQHSRLAEAHDKMAEFNGIYDLYAVNPQLVMAGSFRERLGAIIAQSGGSIIVPQGSASPVILLP
jgi:membrane protease subunit HflK